MSDAIESLWNCLCFILLFVELATLVVIYSLYA